MRDILRALAEGEISVTTAESELKGYITTESGRFDTAREARRGIPEAIIADGKTPTAVTDLASAAVETTGRAIITRADQGVRQKLRAVFADEEVQVYDRAGIVVIRGSGYEPPLMEASVAVVTGGASDEAVAEEAAVIVEETGASVERISDVGVAGIHRLFDHVELLRSSDVIIVAAGREGALPTIVAGLVNSPVIGLPVSTGYGYGGEGEAALLGMLQSCAVISVVNIDAGFIAGAQAGLIAGQVSDARRQE